MVVTPLLRRAAVVAVGVLTLALAPLAPAFADAAAVSISAPVAHAAVTGTTAVTFSGTTDTAGTDLPASWAVLLDGVSVATGSCSGTTYDCGATTSFDATGLSGDAHALTAELLLADTTVAVTSDPVPVQGILPTVAITGPVSPTVAGGVRVDVTAAIDASLTEVPQSIALFADGVQIGSNACSPAARTCDTFFMWDVTALTGTHTLTATFTTNLGRSVTTAGSTFTVDNPAPSVAITAPTTATVGGAVHVDVTASTADPVTDYPSTVELYDGATKIRTFACPLQVRTCSTSFGWDVTTLTGTHDLTAKVTTTTGRTATSPVSTFTVDNPAPTVSITAPAGSTIGGSTLVQVTAATDPSLTEFPATVELVDGVTSLGTRPCPVAQHTCDVSFGWDVTALSGSHTLKATVTTDLPRSVTSAGRTFTVANPAPTTAITSPAAASTVSRTVTVTATAETDSGLTEYPATIDLLAGTKVVARAACPLPQASHTCSVSLSWDTTGLSGTQTLTTFVTTSRSRTAVSAPVGVTVDNPAPTVVITAPVSSTVGGATTVEVTAATDAGLSEHPAKVELFDGATSIGTFTCPASQHTCDASFDWDVTTLSGAHTLTAKVTTDLPRTVTSAGRTFTVANPAPTTAITSPAASATVSRTVTVTATAGTDPGLTEYPASIDLLAGSTVVDSAACPLPHTTHTCSVSLSWDTTGLSGAQSLTTRVTTTISRTADSDPVGVTVANPAPTVTITSPTAGASATGRVTVRASASTDPGLSDFPASVDLLVGTAVVGTRACPSPQTAHDCTVSFTWDVTGQSGARVLSTRVRTTRSAVAPSASVAVTVVNVAPTVTITSPSAGAAVSGSAVIVRVTATTDARRSDTPKTLVLKVDGVARTTVTCAGTTHSCSTSLRWNASRSVGVHHIVVTLATTGGFRATSAARTLYALSASRLVLTPPAVVRGGSTAVLGGRVLAVTTGTGMRGVPVTVTVRPASGPPTVLHTFTGASGTFAVRWVARGNATATAVTTRLKWLTPVARSAVVRVSAPITCRLSTAALAVGAVGSGSCSVPGLPAGARLTLRYILNGRTSTLATGQAKGPAISFSFGFARAGTYLLRVDLAAGPVFVATSSGLMRVVVG